MWLFRKKGYEYKKCSRCNKWSASFDYGDVGQLCSGCFPWVGREYKIKYIVSILIKVRYAGLVLLFLAIWNYQGIIKTYNETYFSITEIASNTYETIHSWTVWKPESKLSTFKKEKKLTRQKKVRKMESM